MGYHDRYLNDDRAAWGPDGGDNHDNHEFNDDFDDADVTSTDGSDCDPGGERSMLDDHPDDALDPVRWAKLPRGDGLPPVWVCSDGAARLDGAPFHHVDPGLPVQGTPYREYVFPDGQRMLMQDMVWTAFYGPPPPGWVVRHAGTVPVTDAAHPWMYSNALQHLNIYRM